MEQNTCRESMLLSIYQECNEHAREQAKMRNSMITIYLALYAAYIALLNGEKELSFFSFCGLFVIMLLIGFFCVRTTIDYRCWIIRYTSCARSVSAFLMQGNFNDSAANISETLRMGTKQSKKNKKNIIGRMGNLIIFFFIMISSTPIIFLVDRINKILVLEKIAISAGYIIVYSTIQIIVLVNEVKKVENEGGEIEKYKNTPRIFDFDQRLDNDRFS